MAVVAAVLGGCALFGGLCTYAGIKFFQDTPSTDHVTTIVKNEIAAHIDADNTHETFQNNTITIIVAVIGIVFILLVLRSTVITIQKFRRFNADNNNNNNAVSIDA